MTTIKAILFDHDGTLVDSEQAHFEMWVSILARYQTRLTFEEYVLEHAGIPTPANAKALVERHSLQLLPSVLVQAKQQATEAYLDRQAFPLTVGARETLFYFSNQGIRLGIVTGAGREGVDKTIERNQLQDIIEVIVSGDDVAHSKPAPDCYRLAVERLGLQPAECIAIEDSENGVRAAVAADIACVAVATDITRHHDLSRALVTVKDLDAARRWISGLAL